MQKRASFFSCQILHNEFIVVWLIVTARGSFVSIKKRLDHVVGKLAAVNRSTQAYLALKTSIGTRILVTRKSKWSWACPWLPKHSSKGVRWLQIEGAGNLWHLAWGATVTFSRFSSPVGFSRAYQLDHKTSELSSKSQVCWLLLGWKMTFPRHSDTCFAFCDSCNQWKLFEAHSDVIDRANKCNHRCKLFSVLQQTNIIQQEEA